MSALRKAKAKCLSSKASKVKRMFKQIEGSLHNDNVRSMMNKSVEAMDCEFEKPSSCGSFLSSSREITPDENEDETPLLEIQGNLCGNVTLKRKAASILCGTKDQIEAVVNISVKINKLQSSLEDIENDMHETSSVEYVTND